MTEDDKSWDDLTKYDNKVAGEGVEGEGTPHWRKDVFRCPHWGAHAQQVSYKRVLAERDSTKRSREFLMMALWAKVCQSCHCPTLWDSKGTMVYPGLRTAPSPHPDMPNRVWKCYEEAASILDNSPRGAAAR